MGSVPPTDFFAATPMVEATSFQLVISYLVAELLIQNDIIR